MEMPVWTPEASFCLMRGLYASSWVWLKKRSSLGSARMKRVGLARLVMSLGVI